MQDALALGMAVDIFSETDSAAGHPFPFAVLGVEHKSAATLLPGDGDNEFHPSVRRMWRALQYSFAVHPSKYYVLLEGQSFVNLPNLWAVLILTELRLKQEAKRDGGDNAQNEVQKRRRRKWLIGDCEDTCDGRAGIVLSAAAVEAMVGVPPSSSSDASGGSDSRSLAGRGRVHCARVIDPTIYADAMLSKCARFSGVEVINHEGFYYWAPTALTALGGLDLDGGEEMAVRLCTCRTLSPMRLVQSVWVQSVWVQSV
jgi:hypothetical protein